MQEGEQHNRKELGEKKLDMKGARQQYLAEVQTENNKNLPAWWHPGHSAAPSMAYIICSSQLYDTEHPPSSACHLSLRGREPSPKFEAQGHLWPLPEQVCVSLHFELQDCFPGYL